MIEAQFPFKHLVYCTHYCVDTLVMLPEGCHKGADNYRLEVGGRQSGSTAPKPPVFNVLIPHSSCSGGPLAPTWIRQC